MTRENFSIVQPWVLAHEGGYVNNRKDPGGATNMGIIQRTYDA
ncbi:glycosyl hydrolase 108 family protein, partial [Sulfitobacter sp. HI0129]